MNHLWIKPLLGDFTLEGATRVGINGKTNPLPGCNTSNIGLINIHLQLHGAEILCNQKHLARFLSSGDNVSLVDHSVKDDPLNGSCNLSMCQIVFLFSKLGLAQLLAGEGGRYLFIELIDPGRFGFYCRRGHPVFYFSSFDLGIGVIEGRLGLIDLSLGKHTRFQ